MDNKLYLLATNPPNHKPQTPCGKVINILSIMKVQFKYNYNLSTIYERYLRVRFGAGCPQVKNEDIAISICK